MFPRAAIKWTRRTKKKKKIRTLVGGKFSSFSPFFSGLVCSRNDDRIIDKLSHFTFFCLHTSYDFSFLPINLKNFQFSSPTTIFWSDLLLFRRWMILFLGHKDQYRGLEASGSVAFQKLCQANKRKAFSFFPSPSCSYWVSMVDSCFFLRMKLLWNHVPRNPDLSRFPMQINFISAKLRNSFARETRKNREENKRNNNFVM